MAFFSGNHLGILDCIDGTFRSVERLPFLFGGYSDVDWRLTGEGVRPRHCTITKLESRIHIVRVDPSARIWINGLEESTAELAPNTDYSLKIGEHLFLLRVGRGLEDWSNAINTELWYLRDMGTGVTSHAASFESLPLLVQSNSFDPYNTVLYPHGSRAAFYLNQVFDITAAEDDVSLELPPTRVSIPIPELPSTKPTPPIDIDKGNFACPTCWLRFDAGDAMHIAIHDSLRGDPILGPDAFQRFHATRFNDRGQALDAMGLPSTDLACPHCRRRLPHGFLELPTHIFSIVGATHSGKSYYLTVLVKRMEDILFRDFGLIFRDADPEGNSRLNDMRSKLFSAASPEQAYLTKTDLEGEMYERVNRFGREVLLPKPFVFSLARNDDDDKRVCLVFYDNAGEHFQPGRDSATSPGAQHVASASAILFLFDPTTNLGFRAALADHPDPQLKVADYQDQQDIILSESDVRIRRLLGLTAKEKVDKPVAVIVGKCDTWEHLLGRTRLRDPLGRGSIDGGAMRENSQAVRTLLMGLCPAIVANAEAISTNVMYFPVSSLGHSPVQISDAPKKQFAPVPSRMAPRLVEIPVLWALSQVDSSLISIKGGG